jgi:signal transduction histidine kinase
MSGDPRMAADGEARGRAAEQHEPQGAQPLPAESTWLSTPVGALATFLMYVAAGVAGLSASLPPGVAAPVWPAAGVALAAVILGGMRLVPVVWAASLVVNLSSLGGDAPEALAASSIAALGAAAQAAFGAHLVRRFLADPGRLLRARDAVRFVMLTGPVACLVSASVGPTAYLLLGVIPAPQFPFEHVAWYVGDALGTLGVAPLLLSLFATPASLWRPRVWGAATPLVGITLLCVVVFQLVRTTEEREAASQARLRAASLASTYEGVLLEAVEKVDALASYFAASERVTADEFGLYTNRPLAQPGGIVALGWRPAAGAESAGVYLRPAADPLGEMLRDDTAASHLAPRAVAAWGHPDDGPLADLVVAVAVDGENGPRGHAFGRIDLAAALRTAIERDAVVDDTSLSVSVSLLPGDDQHPGGTAAAPRSTTVRRSVRIGEARLLITATQLAPVFDPSAWNRLELLYLLGLVVMTAFAAMLLVVAGRTALLEMETDQRRVAERRLSTVAADLERSNGDLESFAYVASHDLRAPLRAIRGLASWIAADSAAQLTDESKKRLELLQGRASRLDAMVEGLLNYSRAGRSRATPDVVTVRDVVDEAIELAGVPSGFEVSVGVMPSVYGHRAALQQVFTNLIANAVRHHDQPSGTIRVSAYVQDNLVTFRVVDDGPGIPPAAHADVFALFKTLRSRDEVEGSGLGLSIVKRLVEAEGGVVRVESSGRGTAIVFTWPTVVDDAPR